MCFLVLVVVSEKENGRQSCRVDLGRRRLQRLAMIVVVSGFQCCDEARLGQVMDLEPEKKGREREESRRNFLTFIQLGWISRRELDLGPVKGTERTAWLGSRTAP